jgi:hypothetical protein
MPENLKNVDVQEEQESLSEWVEDREGKEWIYLFKWFGETKLEDLDNAWLCFGACTDAIEEDKKPVLDFTGIEEISYYWMLIAVAQWAAKYGERTNEIIGVFGLNAESIKKLSELTREVIEDPDKVLANIRSSQVSTELPTPDA